MNQYKTLQMITLLPVNIVPVISKKLYVIKTLNFYGR